MPTNEIRKKAKERRLAILQLYENGTNCTEIGKMYGISKSRAYYLMRLGKMAKEREQYQVKLADDLFADGYSRCIYLIAKAADKFYLEIGDKNEAWFWFCYSRSAFTTPWIYPHWRQNSQY